jgi:hypothetical protein
MNQTAEVIVSTHHEKGADMTEFKSLQIGLNGKSQAFDWNSIPFAQADNNSLVDEFRRGRVNCFLWRKSVARSIYEQALLLMGYEMCTAVINVLQDRLHCASIIRFVRHFVRIDYVGYRYYRNIYNCSSRRKAEWKPCLTIVNSYIAVIFARPWPATFDRTALRTLCSMIAA